MREKEVRDSAVQSLLYADLCTWNNDGIRKCSFMVPEYINIYILIWLFKKADRIVCPLLFFFFLFNDYLTEPIQKKIS